jgi:hypothetical protein
MCSAVFQSTFRFLGELLVGLLEAAAAVLALVVLLEEVVLVLELQKVSSFQQQLC